MESFSNKKFVLYKIVKDLRFMNHEPWNQDPVVAGHYE